MQMPSQRMPWEEFQWPLHHRARLAVHHARLLLFNILLARSTWLAKCHANRAVNIQAALMEHHRWYKAHRNWAKQSPSLAT